MANRTKQSAKSRMLATLRSGKTLTTAQARSRFGIQNVSQRITEMRQDGHPIVTALTNSGTAFYAYGESAAMSKGRVVYGN